MRCALEPAWYGIAIDEAMSQFDNMQADALTVGPALAKGGVMTRTPLLITLAAAAALAGCNSKDHTIVAGEPGDNAAATAPVALPPSITASKVYRCADNAVVYVNWLSDGSATVRDKPDATPTVVAAGSAELKGGADAKSITYKGESCKA